MLLRSIPTTFCAAFLVAFLPTHAASGLCPSPGDDGEERTPGTPIVLDLNGDGIHTTSIYEPVRFDLDADGVAEEIAWTNYDTGEGFLWRDLDGNELVSDGSELFGDATRLADGTRAEHGFEALAMLDEWAHGGNGDGMLSPRDRRWAELRLWVDRNGDGVSQPEELARLAHHRVVALSLDFVETSDLDGNMNWHRFRGVFTQRVGDPGQRSRVELVTRDLVDVIFATPSD